MSKWTEIIYDTKTNAIIATQEFDKDRGIDHDWVLQKDQAFIRLNRDFPNEDISDKRLNVAKDDLEINPSYVSVEARKQAEKDAVTSANTIADLKALLIQNIDEQYLNSKSD